MRHGNGKIVLRQGTSCFESGIRKPDIFELEQKHFSQFGNTQLSRLHTELNRRRFDNSVSPSENRTHYTNQQSARTGYLLLYKRRFISVSLSQSNKLSRTKLPVKIEFTIPANSLATQTCLLCYTLLYQRIVQYEQFACYTTSHDTSELSSNTKLRAALSSSKYLVPSEHG